MYHSKNTIVCNCFNHAILDAYLLYLFFLRTTGVDIFKQQLWDVTNQNL